MEEKKATHSSFLIWKIPWTEEPGGLQSMGSQIWTRLSDYHSLTRSFRDPEGPLIQMRDRLGGKGFGAYCLGHWHPTPVLLPGESHGRGSLVGCSPWGRSEWDTTERLHFHFSLSCIGEGNGNPLQYSCLENPMGRGSLGGCRLWGRAESDTTE